MRTSITSTLILVIGWFILFESPAYAYLDLSTGTYFVQILAGFSLAIILSARNKLKWLQGLFSKKAIEKPSSITSTKQTGKIDGDE